MDFLRMMLDAGKGWCEQKEIAAQGKALGFSDKELRTARKHLGIVSKKDGLTARGCGAGRENGRSVSEAAPKAPFHRRCPSIFRRAPWAPSAVYWTSCVFLGRLR